MKQSAPALLVRRCKYPVAVRLPCKITSARTSQYHSSASPDEPPFPLEQEKILSNSLRHVPTYGFSHQSLLLGARDAGYLDVSVQLFPRGAFDLVNFYRVTRRLALKDRIQFESGTTKVGIGAKIRTLALERLKMNAEDGVVGQLQGAIALSSLLGNIPSSLRELSSLSDEMWYLASDTDVTFSWYSKRASLAAIYASTELFMTTDKSKNYKHTEEFFDRRLRDVMTAGQAIGDTGKFIGFWAGSAVNFGRSLGLRI